MLPRVRSPFAAGVARILRPVFGRLAPPRQFQMPISFAFQPIVHIVRHEVVAYEALVRTAQGGGAGEVFQQVNEGNFASFDLTCRTVALSAAANAGILRMPSSLCININPNQLVKSGASLRKTLRMAAVAGIPMDRIIFELTEGERATNIRRLNRVMSFYRRRGIRFAIDDFGAGFAGLSLLAELEADIVKLDIGLVRNIDGRTTNRNIVEGIVRFAEKNGIGVVGEGVETEAEASVLRSLGISLMQGYLFARPQFEGFPEPTFPT